MKEERDIVYLSLPFTAAVAAGNLLSPSYGAAIASAAVLFLSIAYFIEIVWKNFARKSHSNTFRTL